jgi:Asp-tRNA(Asn)/Glu-tRNA(Gln) amidotransferase A subunit family amidase
MPSGKGNGSGANRLRRRDMVKGLLAAGLTAATGRASGDDAAPQITEADLVATERVAGLHFTDAQRRLMVKRTAEIRSGLRSLRAAPADARLEPAFHFDPRLPDTAVPTGRPVFRPTVAACPPYNSNPESVAFAPVTVLARLIRARKLTSTELTRMYLARLKRFGPRLNCVINLTEELAMRQAAAADAEIAAGHYRGPLHGIPWGAKDLLATRGIPTTWGARPYEHQVFDYDATVVRRLTEAGAVLVAKLSMGELAMGDVWFGGLTRNPWDSKRGSSGSSAGPGSAVAAGLVGFAIGTETLGSIVSPSVENGVTGLRPTYGRVPRTGAMALSWTMDKLGPMARGVEDCALVLHAVYGPDGQDVSTASVPFSWDPNRPLHDLRIGFDTIAFQAVEKRPERAAVYQEVLKTLKGLGVQPVPVTLPRDEDAFGQIAELVIDCESAAAFADLTSSGKVDLLVSQGEYDWPNTFRVGATVPAADYLQAMRQRRRLQVAMAEAMRAVDLFVTVPFRSPSLVYTNLTGHPTLVTRCGMADGLPLSVEFTGQLYAEEAILRIARAYEQATHWHTQWPDTEKLPPIPPPPA